MGLLRRNREADQVRARARELHTRFYRLMNQQNTPLVTYDEEGCAVYSDEFPDDPELDAQAAKAEQEYDDFLRANPELEADQSWMPLVGRNEF